MAETPQDLTDILQAPSQVPPALPMPPGIQSFLPKPSLAEKIAPLAVLAASLAIGKNRGGGGLAAGYAGAQNRQEQQDFQHATAMEADAQRNQQIAYQNQVRQQQIQQQDEQRRMQALNLVKQRVATIKDPKQYDQEIDSYASMFQQAGFRGMTPNQLRVAAPFVAPSGKSIAADAVNAWLKNPANAALMKKDPTIVGKVTLRIDTNGDGVAENVPLLRAGEIGGVQFATDDQGNFIGAVESKDPIGTPFQETLRAKTARFIADNKREPTPKEKETLVSAALKEDAAAQRKPDAPDKDPLMQITRTDPVTGEIITELVPKKAGIVNRQPAKDASQAQYTVAGYASRAKQAEGIFAKVENDIAKMGTLKFGAMERVPKLQSGTFQSYDQAARNFVNAVLRRESGAQISPQEMADARKQYLPLPDDTPGTLAQKKANRALVFEDMKRAAGRAYLEPSASHRESVDDGSDWVDVGGGIKMRQKRKPQ